MIIASAQTKPKRGSITKNLLDHYRLIEIAVEKGADLIVFPEMSITGYERENASSLAFSIDDQRLDKLIKLAINKKITIIAGAPIRMNSDIFIGSFIIQPNNSVIIYTKQFLHYGEDEYFKSSFDYNPIIKIGNENISLAICFDIENQIHAENAKKAGCTLYLPSIFYTPNGISHAHQVLSNYAKMYSMSVLMSNFSGESWNHTAAGGSAFWSHNGDLVSQMNHSDSGLLMIEKNEDNSIVNLIID